MASIDQLPLIKEERHFLQQCKWQCVGNLMMPAGVLGYTAKRTISGPVGTIIGVALASGILGVGIYAGDEICARELSMQPEFPTGVAIRQQIRQIYPQNLLLQKFDTQHPGADDIAIRAGATRYGTIPSIDVNKDFIAKYFHPDDALNNAKNEIENSNKKSSLPPLQPTKIEIDENAPITSSAPTRMALPPPSPLPVPAYQTYKEYTTRTETNSSTFLDEILDDTIEQPNTRPNRPSKQQMPSNTPIKSSQLSLQLNQQRRPPSIDDLISTQPSVKQPKLRLKRNQYGDEILEEETFNDRQD